MTRFQAEAGTAGTRQPIIGQKAIVDLSIPRPVGFNGGSTEAGIKKATVAPVFKNLGELVVTSLPTTKDSFKGNVNMGTRDRKKSEDCTGGYSCGGTCWQSCLANCP